MISVREAVVDDLDQLLELYLHLHETEIPKDSEHLRNTWKTIMEDMNHHVIVCEQDGKLISSCICVVVPNLTRQLRPYAFVENIVTHRDYRRRGFATACLNYAKTIAQQENCYKIMLLTGAKDKNILHFYQNAGYNSGDKTAFIQWLNK